MKLLKFLKKKALYTTSLKTNYLFTYICLLVSMLGFCQQNNELQGLVRFDSIALPDINIINLNSKIGTSSDLDGKFMITAKLGDTLQFSSINYTTRKITISLNHLKIKKITVYLEPSLYELKEIEITKKFRVDFGNLTLPKGSIFEIDENNRKTAPNARNLTDPTSPAGGVGGNLLGIITYFTDKLFEKSSERKKNVTKTTIQKQQFSDSIIENYGETFFINHLHIQATDLYQFLDFCIDNGLKDLYLSDEFVIKNFLIIQSKKFLEIKNNS